MLFIIFIQKTSVGEVWGEAGTLVHPGLQGSCGDLVFLTATEKKHLSVTATLSLQLTTYWLYILNLSSLYLHDMYNNSHARHCIPIHCIQHCLGDGLKQVIWFLHVHTVFR